jgi:hypothetical protein
MVMSVRAVQALRRKDSGVTFIDNGWATMCSLAVVLGGIGAGDLFVLLNQYGNIGRARFEFRLTATANPHVRAITDHRRGTTRPRVESAPVPGPAAKKHRPQINVTCWQCPTPGCKNNRGIGCFAARQECNLCGALRPADP